MAPSRATSDWALPRGQAAAVWRPAAALWALAFAASCATAPMSTGAKRSADETAPAAAETTRAETAPAAAASADTLVQAPAAEATRPAAVGRAEVREIAIDSAAMGEKEWPALVVLPPAYRAEPDRRFPVLYILHGAGGDHVSWVDYLPLAALLQTRPAICVCVYGRAFGWYVDSPCQKNSQVETHVTGELVPFVDANFRTIARKEGRGIFGYSMGGHGAITLAAKHPDLFSSASSISGIMDLTRWPSNWRIAGALGPLAANQDLWRRSSAMGLAGEFTKSAKGARLLIECGTADFAYPENREFHALLERLGIPHEYREGPGDHGMLYASGQHLAMHMDFHLASFAKALAGAER